jgi:hypothetical protein
MAAVGADRCSLRAEEAAGGLPAKAFESFPSVYDEPPLDASILESPHGFLALSDTLKGS